MKREWEIITVGECVDILTGFPFKSKQYTGDLEDTRLLRGDNIAQTYLRWEQAKRWPKDEFEQYDKFKLEDGDIVLAMDRPWIAAGLKIARVQKKDLPSLLVQRVARLRGSEKLDTRFLYYLLTAEEFTNYVLNVQTGTGVPHISTSQIKDYKFILPPIHVQKGISEILGDLDDKIELNLRMNETLEQMAMALYKHWFIDFGPFQDGEFEESELGMIPKGWRVDKVGNVSINLNNKRKPLSALDRQGIKGGYPYYGAGGILDYINSYMLDGVFLLVGEDGTVKDAHGTPFTQYVEGQIWVNNHAHILQGKDNISTEWLLLYLKHTPIDAYITGAVQPKLTKTNLNSLPFTLPPMEVQILFTEKISNLYKSIRSNNRENETLKNLRDYLLPRLLSGEIEIGEAEKQVEEVL